MLFRSGANKDIPSRVWKPKATLLFVTFLWSTSWVLIKHGLAEIRPLTFAGLRYTLAAIVLLVYWGTIRTPGERVFDKVSWRPLLLLGIVQFTLTQGAQFLALAHLPAQTTSLALSTTPVIVALLGLLFLREAISGGQFVGILLLVTGGVFYLFPISRISGAALVGIVAVIGAPLANALATVLGRHTNQRLSATQVTTGSMLVGGVTLLTFGLIVEGFPSITVHAAVLLAWLSIVNTGLAFTLWNKSLGKLSATTTSTLHNTMLVQIGILSWVFLDEQLTGINVLGLVLATTGAIVAARKTRPKTRRTP